MAVPHTPRVTACFEPLDYQPLWAGYAIGKTEFKWKGSVRPYPLIVQREGEKPGEYTYKAFLSTRAENITELLTQHYPKRWSIEEFFNFEGDMGWNRAATFNLKIRYGKQSLALIAQAATYQLKNKLPSPCKQWNARHTATQNLGIEKYYRNLPQRLANEGINPRIPWLFDFKLDFRFK